MEKYFKIGEISELYHIGVDSLRYYEKIGVISPKRSESGYRLYSIQDIWRLNVIRELRELGFSMASIRQYLDSHTVESTLALLQREQDTIDAQMKKLRKLKANVSQRMRTIREADSRTLNRIRQETLPCRPCHTIREGYSDEHEMDVLIQRLLNLDKKHFYVIGSNEIGTVISREKFENTGKLRYQSVFLMDEGGNDVLPAGTYLTVSYSGDYQKSGEWAEKLLQYARSRGMVPAGDFLEILWIDIHTTSDPEQQITELQLGVRT